MDTIITITLFATFVWIIASVAARNHDAVTKINTKAKSKARRQARKIINSLTTDKEDE